MTLLFPVALPPFPLKDDEFFGSAMPNNLGFDQGTINDRGANFHIFGTVCS
jgi:hypothetical protein